MAVPPRGRYGVAEGCCVFVLADGNSWSDQVGLRVKGSLEQGGGFLAVHNTLKFVLLQALLVCCKAYMLSFNRVYLRQVS